LLVAGCASSPTVTTERHFEREAARLERQTDADSLAAAFSHQICCCEFQAD
jgi:hypothetical protein